VTDRLRKAEVDICAAPQVLDEDSRRAIGLNLVLPRWEIGIAWPATSISGHR
jgi:hypothetical protein